MSHKMIQRYPKLVSWLRLLTTFAAAMVLLGLYLIAVKPLTFASEVASLDIATPALVNSSTQAFNKSIDRGKLEHGQPSTDIPFHNMQTFPPSTLRETLFWNTSFPSETVAFMGDHQIVTPGSDDQAHVVVQLNDDPVAVYINRTFGPDHRTRLLASEVSDIQEYADNLAIARKQFLAQVEQQGIQVEAGYEFSYLFNGLALSIKNRDRRYLERFPQVKAVYRDRQLRVTLNESVPLIGAPSVWAMTDDQGQPITGEGIRVAILDTGVDYTHPDLGGGFGPDYKVIGGYDVINDDNDPMDDQGHGTHVAGIVAADGQVTGVAPDANLLAYKVCDAGGYCYDWSAIAGLERAADPDGNPATNDGAHVINMSFGGLGGKPDDPMSQAIDNAVDQGIVVVVSAGNSGPDFKTVEYPGVARKALTVAASNKSDQLAGFSSRGPIPDFYDILKPDITAPGVAISSTYPMSDYVSLGGTSMAAPHIAGAVALLKQLHPDWTSDMLKANLMNTGKDLGGVLYEQGAGRIQVAEAAKAPLVAVPGSLAFGLPLLDDTTSAQLTLINTGDTTMTATASTETMRWADGKLAPLTSTIPVTYAQLNDYNFTISPGVTEAITVSLDIPSSALEGYYTGRVILRGTDYTLTVPFAFTLLSKVTVHILDENGVEWLQSRSVHMVRVPEIDVQQSNRWNDQAPATLYVPSGTYNVHGHGKAYYYDYVLHSWGAEQHPLILATTAVVTPNESLDIYLNAATARRFTLDATTFSGDPLFVAGWRAVFRYQNAGQEYITEVIGGYGGFKDTDLLAPLPDSLDFYISDTPDYVSFIFASQGYGYSPRHLHFRDLNSAKWYEGPGDETGFNLIQNADEVHLFEWKYSKIDASTPTTFAYAEGQVGRYRMGYDFPGAMNDPWLEYGYSFASGGDTLFYVPTDYGVLMRPQSAGWERDMYVKGLYAYRYWADDVNNSKVFEREFYTRDWTKTYTATTDTNLQMFDIWELQPLSPKAETVVLGTGPLYPAVTFRNVTSTIQLVHPVFGAGHSSKATWGDYPDLVVYKDDEQFSSTNLQEFWWSPSPIRQVPVSDAGDYRVLIASNHENQVSYNNTIKAGFTLPAADMNPPQVLAMEMPQRFAPNQTITATLIVTDAESGVSSVEMRYSLDEGISWIPITPVGTLLLPQEGTVYTTTINPSSALIVSLAYTITDDVGNYLAFTTLGAAIRETPVTLTLKVSPTIIPLSSHPFTMTLAGTLRKNNDEPLSKAALPIAIYLNKQLAGYVRDVTRLSDGDFLTGTIGFDWTFIPTDFITRPGTAELRFIFDIGTYARQEKTFTIILYEEYKVYLPLVIRNR